MPFVRPVSVVEAPFEMYLTIPLPNGPSTDGDDPSSGVPVGVDVARIITTFEKSDPGFVQLSSIWLSPGAVLVAETLSGERLSIVMVALVPSVPEEALLVGVNERMVLVTAYSDPGTGGMLVCDFGVSRIL